jgi:type I restriction-modification system DNA methylase subunit
MKQLRAYDNTYAVSQAVDKPVQRPSHPKPKLLEFKSLSQRDKLGVVTVAEKATERTYATELAKAISTVGSNMFFDAEVEKEIVFERRVEGKSRGYVDVVIYYEGKPIAVIEVKRPEISLSDPELNKQALQYAEWYRKRKGIQVYGIHNMRYLKLFKYVAKTEHEKRQKTLLDYITGAVSGWVPVSDFPFKIMPWVSSIDEYKQITTVREARENLWIFLLYLKEILEDKTLDLSKEAIDTIRSLIEEAASRGISQLEKLYKESAEVKKLIDTWLGERGYEKPRSDSELRNLLDLLLKEQIYTFTMKLLFYLVLQSIDADMAAKLRESIKPLEEANDPNFFKKIAEELFKYAIERTGDFEEIFGQNAVDKLPFMPATLPKLKEIVRYLNQIRWSEINVDVIGRVFEGLIYEERRHLLGQHYTDTKIVDLILAGVFRKSSKPSRLLDPACGSGTFLVRALNYWKTTYYPELDKLKSSIYEYIEGVDIDKLASMLAKINLYIQALEEIKKGYKYIPRIRHGDFFKVNLNRDYEYIVTNPPYTKQVELTLAFYDKNYRDSLLNYVRDIEGWDKRASIYAYFLVRSGKLLKENGALGFIVENSWLNAEYGIPLRKWLFKNFTVEYVIESLVERWFEDAAVNTNIIISRKIPASNYITRFVYLKRKLNELIDPPPPATDFIANERYYEKLSKLYEKFDLCTPDNEELKVCEDIDLRVVAVKKSFIEKIESRIGRMGVLRAPTLYLSLLKEFVDKKDNRIILLGEIVDIQRGLTTNADEVFYLPSKYWEYVTETPSSLILKSRVFPGKVLSIGKRYLRRLITPEHVTNCNYEILVSPVLKRDDYVIWVENISEIDDPGIKEYLDWVKEFVNEEYKSSGGRKFIILYKQFNSNWTKLKDTSGGLFIFRKGIHKNYGVLLNRALDAQFHQRLYIGYMKKNIDIKPETLFAIVNSIITYIGVELVGQTSLGEGVLDVKTTDYERVPVVNPLWLEGYLKKGGLFDNFIKVVHKVLSLKPADIEVEAGRPERMEMEKYVLGSLGFSESDIRGLYRELIELVRFRTERARRTGTVV